MKESGCLTLCKPIEAYESDPELAIMWAAFPSNNPNGDRLHVKDCPNKRFLPRNVLAEDLLAGLAYRGGRCDD